MGNAWIIGGTAVIAIGGIVAQIGWNRLDKQQANRTIAIGQIIAGTILFSLGGLAATNGWNARTVAEQRQAIVRSLAAEMLINLNVIKDEKFTAQDPDALAKLVIFPRLQTTAISGAITSGLFGEKGDKVLWTRIFNLKEVAEDFNRRLDWTEFDFAIHPDRTRELRIILRDGKTRDGVRSKLVELGKLLLTDFGIQEADEFFVELK